MPITFNCPQGHRLTCPDELAGKPGKCPKCGVVVRVPQANASASPKLFGGPVDDEPASRLEAAGDGMTASDLAADQIIFLCPNGHRLHGSADLAGRPGQCPHCGIRFLVPSPDEDDDEGQERFLEEEVTETAPHDFVIQIDTSGKGGSSKTGKGTVGSNSAMAASVVPLASLLSKLWRYKSQGASVEIHLGDGKLLEPDEISLKDAHHALFATREAGGAHTLTAVAWSSIERIVVRGLEQLPKEWF
jgi:hypothetical protein